MQRTSKMQRRRILLRESSSGVVAVEFALVLPFILLIFLGSIELANLNFIRNMANDSAYRVAREMIVPGATSSEATHESEKLLKKIGVKNARIDVRESTDKVTVNVTIPISDNSWSVGALAERHSISESCTLRKSLKSE